MTRGTYSDVITRFAAMIDRVVRPGAVVAVASRGDASLLELGEASGWHFPQRSDGVYAGYYPADSAAAIQHLERVRKRGAEYFALPASALWWIDHYDGLARHIDKNYTLLARDEEAGAIYALVDDATPPGEGGNGKRPAKRDRAAKGDNGRRVEAWPPRSEGSVDEDIRTLFDAAYYAEQSRRSFNSQDAALTHFLEHGALEGLNPHPLFDTRWYVSHYPEATKSPKGPLLHYLERSIHERQNPNPFFDTDHYYVQRPGLPYRGINALVHYLQNSAAGQAGHPNPLLRDVYYRNTYRDVRDSGVTPLEHFLHGGCAEGRYGSHFHRNMLDRLRQSSLRTLTRGNWKTGSTLVFARGGEQGESFDTAALAEHLADEYRLDTTVVALRRAPGSRPSDDGDANILVLEDYELVTDVFFPSALRVVATSLARMRPVFAITEIPETVETLGGADIPTYFLAPGARALPPVPELAIVAGRARKVMVPSTAAATAVRERLRRRPRNVEVARRRGPAHARSVAAVAARDLKLAPRGAGAARSRRRRRPSKVIIPCSDWNVSGVNAALEAAGKRLVAHGWDVELLFTRDEDTVLASAHEQAYLPTLPYRFLERPRSGVDGMWEALVTEVGRQAPCILLLAYDFIGNCVVPALDDDVGVVLWVQADDGDYYEQAYRLGRYCNAVVCVSSLIREKVAQLNPVIGDRAHVIHNTSVESGDVARRRLPASRTMRLVYTGRLVQYQKRILDYVDLCRALDQTGVPYALTLIGSFVEREGSRERFERSAHEHLKDGRIRLAGRMQRDDILAALSRNDFFVLLSDFEGLPLALVEAMARGCVPVVAESDSGIPELVTTGENGIVLGGRDYDVWAQVLVDTWRDRELATTLSRAARDTIRTGFTTERTGRQFHDLLSTVADEIAGGTYARPPALHWGVERSPTGDVLAAPSLFRPSALVTYPGLT